MSQTNIELLHFLQRLGCHWTKWGRNSEIPNFNRKPLPAVQKFRTIQTERKWGVERVLEKHHPTFIAAL